MLDLISILVFFVSYKFYGILTATKILMLSSFLILTYKYIKKEIKKIDIISFFAIIIFGSFTLFLNDPYYIKIKVSILYIIIGFLIIIAELINKSLFKEMFKMLSEEYKIYIDKRKIRSFSFISGITFLMIAGLNYYIMNNYNEEFWVNFKLFGILPIILLVFGTTLSYIIKTSERIKD